MDKELQITKRALELACEVITRADGRTELGVKKFVPKTVNKYLQLAKDEADGKIKKVNGCFGWITK
jgi:hypothetical protein